MKETVTPERVWGPATPQRPGQEVRGGAELGGGAWPEPQPSAFLPLGPSAQTGTNEQVAAWTPDDGQSSSWPAGVRPTDGDTPRGNPRGKRQEGGREGVHRPVTTTWASAWPVPALLTAEHWYAPSSALEARGISQLLFPDSLRTHGSWGRARRRRGAPGSRS